MSKTSKPFDYTKPFKMKNGKSARLLADNVKHDSKTTGLVVLCDYDNDTYNFISRYNLDGTEYYEYGPKDNTDLVNIPEITKTYYAISVGGNIHYIHNDPTNLSDAINSVFLEDYLHNKTAYILELVKEDNVLVSSESYPYKKV